MTHDLHLFHCYAPVSGTNHMITIPNGSKVHVKCIGTILLNNGVALHDVLYVPDFHFNLISISKLCKDLSCIVSFTPSACFVQDKLTQTPGFLVKLTMDFITLIQECIPILHFKIVLSYHLSNLLQLKRLFIVIFLIAIKVFVIQNCGTFV